MTPPEETIIPEPEEHESKAAADLRRTLRMLVLATAVLYIFLIAVAVKIYLDGRSTNDALCTFRADRITQVTQSLQFLTANPKGTPGIPAEAIISSVNTQISTINALSGLHCAASAPVPTPFATPTPKGTP